MSEAVKEPWVKGEGRGKGAGAEAVTAGRGRAAAATVGPPMNRRFYTGGSDALAEKLLGLLLVRTLDDGEVLAGRIVETEAYMGVEDAASHAFRGRRTQRNESMYAAPGTAYVYFTYGMHFCFNIVCGKVDEPFAVLVRALEPVLGIERMTALRAAASSARSKAFAPHELCSGPARLCQALAIDRRLNGVDMTSDPRLYVAAPRGGRGDRGSGPSELGQLFPAADNRVVRAARIGVDYAGEWARRPLRWLYEGHPCVSVPAGRSARGGGKKPARGARRR